MVSHAKRQPDEQFMEWEGSELDTHLARLAFMKLRNSFEAHESMSFEAGLRCGWFLLKAYEGFRGKRGTWEVFSGTLGWHRKKVKRWMAVAEAVCGDNGAFDGKKYEALSGGEENVGAPSARSIIRFIAAKQQRVQRAERDAILASAGAFKPVRENPNVSGRASTYVRVEPNETRRARRVVRDDPNGTPATLTHSRDDDDDELFIDDEDLGGGQGIGAGADEFDGVDGVGGVDDADDGEGDGELEEFFDDDDEHGGDAEPERAVERGGGVHPVLQAGHAQTHGDAGGHGGAADGEHGRVRPDAGRADVGLHDARGAQMTLTPLYERADRGRKSIERAIAMLRGGELAADVAGVVAGRIEDLGRELVEIVGSGGSAGDRARGQSPLAIRIATQD